MEKNFKDVEEGFNQLKRKFRQGKISRREFIDRLKKLRLKDEEGRFWMIGAESGKWYYFDGKDWVQSDPPSIEEGKAVCIYCGFENRFDAEACIRCGGNLGEKEYFCPKCGHKLDEPSPDCPYCSKEPEDLKDMEGEAFEDEESVNFVFRSLSASSFLLFWGVLGLFIGIIMGAFTGATDYLYEIAKIMPSFLQELQGKLIGGIIYAGFGGILGFIAFSAFGFCITLLVNVILSFVGGIKIRLDKIR